MKIGVADYGMRVWYGNFYDYDERIRAVRELGFDGWIFIEHDTHLQDPLVDLKESYAILKGWIDEA